MASNFKFEELKASDRLPSPRGSALKVIQLTQKDDVTNQEIARAIMSDPALSGRIIKATNAFLGYQTRPVASVVDAVAILGLNTVRQLVLVFSLVDSNRSGACKEFDYEAFWLRSLLTAITAQNLASHSSIGSPGEIFILGLLAQIGSLALVTAYPQEYALILGKVASFCRCARATCGQERPLVYGKAASCADPELANLEIAEFGIDHNRLTQAMLADWGMPKIFQEAALHHENPDQSNLEEDSRDWRLLNALHVASCLSRLCLAKEPHRHKVVPGLILMSARIGVESGMLAEIGDKVVRESHEWGKLCGIHPVEFPPFADLLKAAPLRSDMIEVEGPSDGEGTFYKLRILLVDDDRAVQLLLETLLKKAGHTVLTARDGKEALSMVEEFMPQLIITDWAMPEMDGIEFCRALRRNPAWRNIYVFIMAAQESAERMVEAFDAGANDYLSKPVNTRVLGARLGAGQRMVQLQEELELDRQQLHKFSEELALSNRRLQQLALTDALTNLPNRRSANEHLERQWSIAERSGRPLSCMMVDIDYFKQVNDTFGHKLGDEVLKQVADALNQSVRKQDVVCRFGGEEFLVICPDTHAEQAYQYAERLRVAVAGIVIHGAPGQDFKLSISIGLASKEPALLNTEMLLQLADKRLYAAKNAGRNRTVAN